MYSKLMTLTSIMYALHCSPLRTGTFTVLTPPIMPASRKSDAAANADAAASVAAAPATDSTSSTSSSSLTSSSSASVASAFAVSDYSGVTVTPSSLIRFVCDTDYHCVAFLDEHTHWLNQWIHLATFVAQHAVFIAVCAAVAADFGDDVFGIVKDGGGGGSVGSGGFYEGPYVTGVLAAPISGAASAVAKLLFAAVVCVAVGFAFRINVNVGRLLRVLMRVICVSFVFCVAL
jgi:hypothetical protein